MIRDLYISFDGGGGGKNDKPFACAIVAQWDQQDGPLEPIRRYTHEDSRPLGWGLTSNIAEWNGLLFALEFGVDQDAREITIRSDSMLIVEQSLGNWRVKDEKLKPLYYRAQELAAKFQKVDISHVPREQNRRADKLCNTEIDRQIRHRDLELNHLAEVVLQT